MWEGFIAGTILWVAPAVLGWLIIGPFKLRKQYIKNK
jgi:hypothetical protein